MGCEKARTETSVRPSLAIERILTSRCFPVLCNHDFHIDHHYCTSITSLSLTPGSRQWPLPQRSFVPSVTWQILQMILQAIMTLPLCNHFIPSFSFKLDKSNFLHSFPTPSFLSSLWDRVLLSNIIWSHVHDPTGSVSDVPLDFKVFLHKKPIGLLPCPATTYKSFWKT